MTDVAAADGRFVRSPALTQVIVPFARVMARFYFRAHATGMDRIPTDRPVIYVAKHPQTFLYLETVILALFTFWDNDRPPIRVLEKINTSVHRTPLLGWMRRNVNAVPATEEAALGALAHGESLLIYPGGSRELYGARDQLQWQGRTGFARIAIRAGVSLQPFAIAGADRQHLGRLPLGNASVWLPPIPLPVSLEYRFGEPLAPTPGETPEALAARAESATRTLLTGG